tara:strand:+ start:1346 stop:1831 length:486 start_codon:yes stop_codon:yes gene_type:complete
MNIDNLIHDKLCQFFIDLYKNNDEAKQVFNDKKVLRLYDLINKEETIKQLIAFIHSYSHKNVDPSFYINNMEVVEWNEGQGMDWHRDYPIYKGTSVIFLNDNFEGGELITASDYSEAMSSTRVVHKPKKGSVVSFKEIVWHKVNPVIKGKRYTLAIWYNCF